MELHPTASVRARGRRFLVLDLRDHGKCRSVRLSPCEDDGTAITLLHPHDRIDVLPVADIPKPASRRRVARCCASAIRAGHAAGQTRAAVDARIQLLPYQFDPALAILRGEATRVLLADEVGLGKTVQAGLVLSELRARQALSRALVLTPAGLREQWAAELRERFRLDVATIDAADLASLQRALPPWVNLWTIPGIVVASIDLLKRNELLPQLETVLWDAVVIDEAHHASRGTDRQALASLVCGRSRIVLLISATPHSGDETAFTDLCSLGALSDGGAIRIFRRTREEVWPGARRRRTCIVRVARTTAERRIDRQLRAYTGRVWRESAHRADTKDGARLAMVILRKRALSGTASLARSLARRLTALDEGSDARLESQLSLQFDDWIGVDLSEEDREPGGELGTPGLSNEEAERSALAELLESARAAVGADSKGQRLLAAVTGTREPVIVFTEYRDTLDDLQRRLRERVTVALLHGAMMPCERREAIQAFENGAARVLLATDAAAEGLNLHRRCRWVIHYEIPWSPTRIEQRNGRVDRLGQERRVHAWHMVAAETEEEQVLARLARRAELAARDLDERIVARAVFEGTGISPPESSRPRVLLPRRGAREIARVALLRRLPVGPRAAGPLCERGLSRQQRVTAVFRLTVLDAQTRSVTNECIAVEGARLDECRRQVQREAGWRARRCVALDRQWSRAVERRATAIRSVLLSRSRGGVQGALFDRTALALTNHRKAELCRALSDLGPVEEEAGRYTVRISLVGVLAQNTVP